jgi:hypothetical protein
MTQSQITQLIAHIRKDVPSSLIKIQHDTLFGNVTVKYVDTSARTQQIYRLIKELFSQLNLPITYKGSYFIVTYGSHEDALQRMFNEAKSVADELIGR